MRVRAVWIAMSLSLALMSGVARAEVQVSQNLFLNNGGLFARGADGVFRQFLFDSSSRLMFNGQVVEDSNPIVDQILGFYCRNITRAVSSSLRFRFFVRAMGSRLRLNGARSCFQGVENLVNNANNSPVQGLFKNILAQEKPLEIGGDVIQPDFTVTGPVPQGGGTAPNGSNTPGGQTPSVPSGTGDITPDGGATGNTPGHAQNGTDEPPQPTGTQQSPPRPEADAGRQLFCSDPQKAICDEAARIFNKPERSQSSRRRALFDKLLASAGVDRAKLLDESSGTRRSDWEKVLRAMRADSASREQSLTSQINGWRQAVIARVNASGVDQNTARQMAQKILAVPVFNMLDLVSRGEVSLDDFLSYCGSDGLATGGFNSRKLIAMCPGHFTELQETEGFLRTLLHEFGHSIDGDIFPAAHRAFEDCIKNIGNFQLGSEQDERQAEVNAAETAARSVRGKSPQEALGTIARFVGRYCPNVGGGKVALEATKSVEKRTDEVFTPGGQPRHFGTDLMLQVLWGRNPDLRETMGCPRASANLPTCSMQGKVSR